MDGKEHLDLVAEVTVVDRSAPIAVHFSRKRQLPQTEVEFSANLAVFNCPIRPRRREVKRCTALPRAALRFARGFPTADWATGTAFLDPNLTSLITTEGGSGPLANTYQLSLQAVPTLKFNCTFGEVTGPFATSVGGGLTATCQPPALEVERHQIVGSWTCRLAQDATTSANWTLRASR